MAALPTQEILDAVLDTQLQTGEKYEAKVFGIQEAVFKPVALIALFFLLVVISVVITMAGFGSGSTIMAAIIGGIYGGNAYKNTLIGLSASHLTLVSTGILNLANIKSTVKIPIYEIEDFKISFSKFNSQNKITFKYMGKKYRISVYTNALNRYKKTMPNHVENVNALIDTLNRKLVK